MGRFVFEWLDYGFGLLGYGLFANYGHGFGFLWPSSVLKTAWRVCLGGVDKLTCRYFLVQGEWVVVFLSCVIMLMRARE